MTRQDPLINRCNTSRRFWTPAVRPRNTDKLKTCFSSQSTAFQWIQMWRNQNKKSTCFHRKTFSASLLIVTRLPCLCWQNWRAVSIAMEFLLKKYWFPLQTSQPSEVVLKSGRVFRNIHYSRVLQLRLCQRVSDYYPHRGGLVASSVCLCATQAIFTGGL